MISVLRGEWHHHRRLADAYFGTGHREEGAVQGGIANGIRFAIGVLVDERKERGEWGRRWPIL